MDLMSTLLEAMTTGDSMQSLTQKTGASSDQVSSLLNAALPALMQQMQSNASTEKGAASLLSALGQHTSTAPISQQVVEADEVDGGKIIGHILGGNQKSVVGSLANLAGLNSNQTSSILASIAPALLTALFMSSKKKKKNSFDLSDGLDLNDVMALLNSGSSSAQSSGLDLGGILGLVGKLFG